jgi:hypothetical protein
VVVLEEVVTIQGELVVGPLVHAASGAGCGSLKREVGRPGHRVRYVFAEQHHCNINHTTAKKLQRRGQAAGVYFAKNADFLRFFGNHGEGVGIAF